MIGDEICIASLEHEDKADDAPEAFIVSKDGNVFIRFIKDNKKYDFYLDKNKFDFLLNESGIS